MKARIALVVLSCLLSAATGVLLSKGSGAAPEARGRGRPLIGLSMDTLKEERWQKDRDLFLKRAQELGADVLVQAANSDDTRQIQDVEALLSRKVDVLVVVPHNGGAMAKAVRLAHEAGIPVISYDRLITDSELDLYVSFDNVKVGETQARYLVEQFRGRGRRRIVRIYGAKTDNNAFLVKQGQDNVLKPYIEKGEIAVVHEDWAENWKPENAKKIVNAAITKGGSNFDAVLSANDGTAGGAIQALSEEGLAGRIIVIGQDAELAACQRIAAGAQAMTVYKPLKSLAGKAAEAAVRMASGRSVVASSEVDNGKLKVPSILLEVVAVTKENMLSTVVKDGLHSYDDVYRGARPSPGEENSRPPRTAAPRPRPSPGEENSRPPRTALPSAPQSKRPKKG
ncbi:MAG: substrate-binding domain-containing protein [Elusimicrobia bacterium]|nr:substrate-binding domain-containing protein [Elusimicrobiota bacterium]